MPSIDPAASVQALWTDAGLPSAALARLQLTGCDPVLPSSFAVGTAAQCAIAAAALAAAEIGALRGGPRQRVAIDMRHAALECTGRFTVDGVAPELWDPLAGLYACGSGHIRLHTNFAHHRDGVLRLLGLPLGADRATVARALSDRNALEFEQEATDSGLVVAALRSAQAWAGHPHAAFVGAEPLVAVERIGDSPALTWPALPGGARPLTGLHVLELTRILAGPFCGRTLASTGAEVMLVNSPHLPNIGAIADTSRGKLSAHADLRTAGGLAALRAALGSAHVFIDGYRPGALAALGFGPAALAALRPGIVVVSLSAYGHAGPWGGKRGFDSLVQTATGFNQDEGDAEGSGTPRALPLQILDMASGALMAFGAAAALHRQQVEGGSWHVRVSLARTGLWLRSLGRIDNGFCAAPADFYGLMERSVSGWGELDAVRPAAQFSHTPAGYARNSMLPGTHPLAWPLS